MVMQAPSKSKIATRAAVATVTAATAVAAGSQRKRRERRQVCDVHRRVSRGKSLRDGVQQRRVRRQHQLVVDLVEK